MPGYVWIVDAFGLLLALLGFNMAFRQTALRRIIGRPKPPPNRVRGGSENADPLTYILRIAGVMLMIFGIAIGGMLTLFNLA
ncbi:hypothetical protein [Sphingobium sp. RSMS]|uniref:Uncharacterized protein n=1 Tax=Sphingobium fuliginis ATCC 27551 TaxID=1208342 RepID=A0A5B8CP89_SPHSA|nr:hypothetical protein [Sphingobium fuliginis]AGH51726.1 hypothetical protein G432_20205 [Sphingomonas sp. MM-1]ARR57541.1 hypothetical protein HY78_28385 [Rhizorhabdus wittichii DC-6]QDC40350.1 hypothetical protein FIL70_23745 [Sphingobium fuliginis ATCC 27551]UXC93875.1 hypothetical protein EGM87_23815 [Sphingobium sp. RSMS]